MVNNRENLFRVSVATALTREMDSLNYRFDHTYIGRYFEQPPQYHRSPGPLRPRNPRPHALTPWEVTRCHPLPASGADL
jgi:hypothetical protein